MGEEKIHFLFIPTEAQVDLLNENKEKQYHRTIVTKMF